MLQDYTWSLALDLCKRFICAGSQNIDVPVRSFFLLLLRLYFLFFLPRVHSALHCICTTRYIPAPPFCHFPACTVPCLVVLYHVNMGCGVLQCAGKIPGHEMHPTKPSFFGVCSTAVVYLPRTAAKNPTPHVSSSKQHPLLPLQGSSPACSNSIASSPQKNCPPPIVRISSLSTPFLPTAISP